MACWLAQIRPFGLLACLITNQASQASCQASLLNSKSELYAGPDRDAETDEEVVDQPQIKLDEALAAL